MARDELPDVVDVIVVGAGLGGLTCAALLAKYGLSVAVCESHTIPGGAAHSFVRDGYCFDSGPSYFLGLSDPKVCYAWKYSEACNLSRDERHT